MKSSTRLKKYLEEFVKQKTNRSKLENLFAFADERRRCGFEKWLQIELMLFFRERRMEVKIEKKVRPDKRKNTYKMHFQTDIVVTMKSGDLLGIELKVRRLAAGAIRALRSDIKKHRQTLTKDKATANLVVVLCGENISKECKKELSNDLSGFHIIEAGRSVFLMAEDGA